VNDGVGEGAEDGDCDGVEVAAGVGVGVEDGLVIGDEVAVATGDATTLLIFFPRFHVKRPLFRIQLYA
jgi:hypothetical protein